MKASTPKGLGAAPSEASTPPRRVGAVVLGAGRSTRMGAIDKLLAPIQGRPMIVHVLEPLLALPLDPVVVVVGDRSEPMWDALAGLPVELADNPHHAEGLSTSIQAGIRALDPTLDGALIALGDMPFVDQGTIERLLERLPSGHPAIVVPTRDGRRGNPVLFSRHFFPAMDGLSGDRGARAIIDAHPDVVIEVEVETAGIHLDVDTPDELTAARRQESG